MTVTLDKSNGLRVYKLTRPIEDSNSNISTKERAGFDVIIDKLGTDNAELHGTMKYFVGSVLKEDNCTGDFVSKRDTDVGVIEAGQQPLPAEVTAFLAITPLSTTKTNVVQNWADKLFSDVSGRTIANALH